MKKVWGENEKTKKGYAIRIRTSEIRSISRVAIGVKGINLRPKDKVVSALLLKNGDEETILTVTENGFGKRTRVNEYPLQKRDGKGVINLKCSEKTGEIIEVKPVKDEEELMAITSNGVVIRTPVDSVSIYGRAAQGVKIMRTSEEEKVVAIAKVKNEKDEERILLDDEKEELEAKSKENAVEEKASENEEFKNKYLNTFENEEDEQSENENEEELDELIED